MRLARCLVLICAGALATGCEMANGANHRRARLDEHLRCKGSGELRERQDCFVEIMRLFNTWPDGAERSRAFDDAVKALARWPEIMRQASTELIVDSSTRRVRDTTKLVRAVVDWYPDDTARNPRAVSRALFASPHAEDITMFKATRADVSLEELVKGPGGRKLAVLQLIDSLPPDPNWQTLEHWPALRTLQVLEYTEGSGESETLWNVLDKAPELHELHLNNGPNRGVVKRLREHEAIAHRLDQLFLRHCNLTDQTLDEMAATPVLDHLIRLDIRQNSMVTRAGVARLKAAPHFARTIVDAGPFRD